MQLYIDAWNHYKKLILIITVIAAILGLAGGIVGAIFFAFFAFAFAYLILCLVFYAKQSPEQRSAYRFNHSDEATKESNTTVQSRRARNDKNQPIYKKWWIWGIVVVVILFGAAISGHDDSSTKSSTASSSSKVSSSSESSDRESEKIAKEKVKNTCGAINQQISQHQELAGFKLKPSDDQFTVIVPPTATSLSDNEQKSVYQSLLKLIYDYDNGTNDGTFVEFQDQMGNPIARSSYTGSGKIKLMK